MPPSFKFLLLDDDPDIRFLHRRALERGFPGCDVIEAESCEEVLGHFATSPSFDAVISDHQLQGPSGSQCISLLRQKGMNGPILLVTGSDDPQVHRAASAAGADRVFAPGSTDFVGYLRDALAHGTSVAPSANGDFFQQLADGAPVMIWMSGLDMGCFYFNRAWLDFRGRTLEQESGNGWAEGVHPEDLETCVSHYVGCFERRVAFAMSYRLKNHAGIYRWILDRGAPHFLPDGTFLGFFGGCAEIEGDTQIPRHNELGSTLASMKQFAARIAVETTAHSATAQTAHNLRRFAQLTREAYAERTSRLNYAVGEMEQLANDMVAFRDIRRGQLIPEVVSAA